jgi:LPXTG-site transpeptidase (sortase) family protein
MPPKSLYVTFISLTSLAFFLISASIVTSNEEMLRASNEAVIVAKSGLAREAVFIENPNLPRHLTVPSLNISADVIPMGVTDTGNMAVPDNYTDVSWYESGVRPGGKGSAVLAGHVDDGFDLSGVFHGLHNIRVGDSVFVTDALGETLHFKVTEIAIFGYKDKNIERIFTEESSSRLNLITCEGKWLPLEKTYDKRLVVFTELVK